MRCLLRACAIALALTPAAARCQEPDPTLQLPVITLQSHSRAVVLDVVVTGDHGHAVHHLKPQDFQIVEDGAPQTIANFDEIMPPTEEERARAAGAKLPVNTYSNANKVASAGGSTGAYTVLLFDALDTAPAYQAVAHEQMVKYLQTAEINTPIAIFSLDTQLHQIQGFTTDIDTLRTAVKDREKVMLTPIPQNAGFVTTQVRFDALTAGMNDLSRYLVGFPGRKNLIWFTGSVPVWRRETGIHVGNALHDPENFNFDFANTADILTLGRVSVYPIDAEGLRTDPSFNAASNKLPTVQSVSEFGIHQFDRHQDLEDIAQMTGGKAFYNTNDLKGAIAEVVESGSNYYSITYYPTNKQWDGKFRQLKVKLDVEGDRLEYRQGYYALADTKPVRRQTGSARRPVPSHPADAFLKSLHLGSIDPGSIVFEARMTPGAEVKKLDKGQPLPKDDFMEEKFRDKPYREVEVAYNVPGKQLQLSLTDAGTMTGQVQFALVVLDDKGLLVNSATSTVDMTLKPATYASIMQKGMNFPVKIAVPVKGNYFIRAAVHDVPSNKAGALEVNVGELKAVP